MYRPAQKLVTMSKWYIFIIIQLFEKIANTLYKKYRTNTKFKELVSPNSIEEGRNRLSSASFCLKRPTSTKSTYDGQ
jgi:hypothetical protein